jgi:aldose sugar dehydrogenase
VQKVPNTSENMSHCLCGGCPSYPGDGGFYCAKGKSGLSVSRRGCLCTDCANFKEFGLQEGYYCINGVAGETAQ